MIAIAEPKREITLECLPTLLEMLLEGCDLDRIDALDKLRHIRYIRTLKNDRARLANKYGQYSPQVLRHDQQEDANDLLIRNLVFEIERRQQPIFENVDNRWQMQGFVRGVNLEALQGLYIKVFNSEGDQVNNPDGDWERLTEPGGFFHLSVDPEVILDDSCNMRSYLNEEVYMHVYASDNVTRLSEVGIPFTVQVAKIDYWEICGVMVPQSLKLPDPYITATIPGAKDFTGLWGGMYEGGWTLEGKVSGPPEVPTEEMNVELFSSDEEVEDLGTATVNKDGSFRVSFDPKKHPRLFKKKADVFLRVVDKDKKELYASRKGLKPKPDKTEKIKTIKLKPKNE
jgi:hypothetical protein